MKKLTLKEKRKYPLGTLQTDYSKNCRDCLKKDHTGDWAYRQCYQYSDKSQKKVLMPVKKEGGKIVYEWHYPVETYDYCYYHMKRRGLLSYQTQL